MKHIANISFGRTSSIMAELLINRYGADNVELIFCDTGAEHPDTYRFGRDVEKDLGVKITCLKAVVSPIRGIGLSYKVCTTADIGPDLEAWKQVTSKYGNPYMPGGKFCTDQLKTQVTNLYCKEKYGKGSTHTWIGYRYGEGNRIWGRDAGRVLGSAGLDNEEKTEFYLGVLRDGVESKLDELFPAMFPSEEDEKEKNHVRNALKRIQARGVRYLPEIEPYTKSDIIKIWSPREHDLKIEEHKTNCVFCIEKPHAVIMLAIKDEPEMSAEFLEALESDEVATITKRSGETKDKMKMYRKGLTFRQLYEKALSTPRDEILAMSRLGQELAKKNPCSSGECGAINIHDDQGDLFS